VNKGHNREKKVTRFSNSDIWLKRIKEILSYKAQRKQSRETILKAKNWQHL